MSQSSSPTSPSQLKTFLNEAPLMYKSALHRGAKKHILTNCYRSLWNNDASLMQKFFFNEQVSDNDSLSQLLEKYNLFGSKETDPTTEQADEDQPEYSASQKGKQCGHLFKRGESVYRCRNCGLDDTCVMCSKCFHSTNHEGHDVKIWISKGAGGCCDCGDPEAWKVPLICSIHSLASDLPTSQHPTLVPQSLVPPHLISSIRDTITVVLDYILETFATSPEDITSIGTVQSIKKDCFDSHSALGLPTDDPNQMYACILWNDEKHSFDAVIRIVSNAIGCTEKQAGFVAECVDNYGRHIIKESTDISVLINVAKIISSINLAVTISSVQKIVREEIAGLLLDWLKELISGKYKFFDNVDGGSCIIRDIICQVLSQDWVLRADLGKLSTRFRRQRLNESVNDITASSENEDVDMNDANEEPLFQIPINEDEIQDVDVLSEEDRLQDLFGDMRQNINYDDDGDSIDFYEEAEEHSSIDLEHNWTYISGSSSEDEREFTQSSYPEFRRSQDRTDERRKSDSSSQSTGDILDMDWDLGAWIEEMKRSETQEVDIAKQLGIPINGTIDDNTTKLTDEFKRKLRIDYVLQFDLRLWKTARISVKDLLISTFISNFEYRPTLGLRFARNYPELVDAFLFKDREPELSVSTLSVQLLTVPTVASLLVRNYKFFEMVCSILGNFFTTDSIHMILPDEYTRTQVDCNSRAISTHRYAYTIYDLRYVMNAEQVKGEICKNPIYLRHLLNMFWQFQAMDPTKRQEDTHVEFESQTWIPAFNLTLQISKVCRLFAGCFQNTKCSTLDASRDLCRTIYRVLKEISDWTPVLAPLKNNSILDTRLLIEGINEQEFVSIGMRNTGLYQIVKYNIAEQPVSFHHPFHWLLSELFENVSLLNPDILSQLGWFGGFKQMVNEAFSDKQETFLTALEYPIRTLALLSQINCGLWVRNGFSIRNQLVSYKDVNVRESTLDCDIYLLQVGFTVCNSNQILLTIMERFQLVEWFKGKYKKSSIYSHAQKIYMIEEFLNLLVICAIEHGYASGASAEQKIHQSIIQFLGISNLSYSELLKFIPDSLTEHEAFEHQLNRVANYKAPDGLNDKGLYELKPEFIQEIEPYFWHYTRNQREEAQNVLKKRWNQLHPDEKLTDKDEFLLIPQVKHIQTGPFKHLTSYLHSGVLCQIIAYALWDAKFHKQDKNDTILDITLYLTMIALLDPNSPASELATTKIKGKYKADTIIDESSTKHFVQYAESDIYPIQVNELEMERASLLVILLRCLEDKDLAHAHKRLNFIINKFELYGSESTKETIAKWKEKRNNDIRVTSEQASLNKESEYERKKAAAKARQAAIMSQFANAQSKFMEQHAAMYSSDEDESIDESYQDAHATGGELQSENDLEIVRKCLFPTDTCIVCQEDLDDTQIYGMLGFVQKSNIQRHSPMDNSTVLADILASSQQQDPWRSMDDNKLPPFTGFPTDAHTASLSVSSCGHLMHAECFEAFQKSVSNRALSQFSLMSALPIIPKTRFLCPLCKALGNVLVPIVWKGKKETYPGVMEPSTSYADLSNNIKIVAKELKNNFENIPDAFDEEPMLINDDPNLVISDKEKLKHLYNQLMRVAYTTMNKPNRIFSVNLPEAMHEMYAMYATTIAGFEIAQRGNQDSHTKDLTVEHTNTFIDNISNTPQMLLKILSMTNTLIPKLMNSSWQAEDQFTKERIALQVINQFMPNTVTYLIDDMVEPDNLLPLLMDDPFKALVRFSFALHDTPSVEIHHVLRSMFIAKITKIIIAVSRDILDGQKLLKTENIHQLLQSLNANHQQAVGASNLYQFASYVLGILKVPQDDFFQIVHPGAMIALIRTFALPFLRKSLLFMVVHHGFIPQMNNIDEECEFDQLTSILNLPSLTSLFDLQTYEKQLVNGWCLDYLYKSSTHEDAKLIRLTLNLPTQYRMTTLPYRLDELLDESLKRVCRKCKTIPEHSAICLICGAFVCARHFCCTKDGQGECNVHVQSCGGEVGVYIMIKDCFLLLLHDNGGHIMNAPYLDSHGEADIYFKRGTQQYLNPKRYEQIRQMWLNQSIPSFVRRKMETSYTSTIWEAY